MYENTLLEILAQCSQILTSIAATCIAVAGFLLSRRQVTSSWLRNLNDLHQLYWKDPDFAKVRSWLASDPLYKTLHESLERRFSNPDSVSEDDYRHIDKLDKFFNFLIRVRIVDGKYRVRNVDGNYRARNVEKRKDHKLKGGRREDKDNLWKRLFFEYWLETIIDRKRWYALFYFLTWYEDTSLNENLSLSLKKGEGLEVLKDRFCHLKAKDFDAAKAAMKELVAKHPEALEVRKL